METPWRDRVGERVALVRRLDSGEVTEVVGYLEAADAELHVRTRRGPVRVPVHAVVAGRVVPPRPVRRGPIHLVTSITDLEGVMALHWRAARTARDGGWLLRASGGFTNRANSVLPLGPPGRDPAAALAHAVSWYAGLGLPAVAAIPGHTPGGVPADADAADALRDECRRAGWGLVPRGSALVLTARTADLRGPIPAPPPDGARLVCTDAPDDAWMSAYRYRGQPASADARRLLTSAPVQSFWSVRQGEEVVAIARGSLGGGWAGLTALEVREAHRRRGWATLVIRAIADRAWRARVSALFLQVSDTNGPARTLYESLGFATHHRYDYLRP